MEESQRLRNIMRDIDRKNQANFSQADRRKTSSPLGHLADVFRRKLFQYQYEDALKDYLNRVKKEEKPIGKTYCQKINKKVPELTKQNRYRYEPKNRDYKMKTQIVEKTQVVDHLNTHNQWKCRVSKTKLFEQSTTHLNTSTNEQNLVSALSKRGHLLTENQDSMLIDKNIWIVCDGHGKNGKPVSHFVSQTILESCKFLFSLTENEYIKTRDHDRLRKNLRELFVETNYELKSEGTDVTLSGCTATLIYKNNQLLIVANCGDSQAFVFRRSGQPLELTKSHKPDEPNERRRIEQLGGIVKKNGRMVFNSGPYRVYNQSGMTPGLAVSRSFGDTVGQACGVTSLPDINFYTIQPEDQYVVLGSDGLFQFFTAEEIKAFCQNYIKSAKPLRQISHALVDEAARRWKTIEHDDITCVFISLKPYL